MDEVLWLKATDDWQISGWLGQREKQITDSDSRRPSVDGSDKEKKQIILDSWSRQSSVDGSGREKDIIMDS